MIASGLAAAGLLLAACAPTVSESVDAGTATPPDADAPLVAFYGDSYTLGTGASDPSKRWSTRICASRGWNEYNPSVNGLGFVKNRLPSGPNLPDRIIAKKPDIVFITMGLNDAYSYDQLGTGIDDAIVADFEKLHNALPDARFIVVEPFWYTSARPEALGTVIDWVKDAADGIGADYIPGASTWIQGREGEMASDGLHPNDAGYDLMTARMDAALRTLGL